MCSHIIVTNILESGLEVESAKVHVELRQSLRKEHRVPSQEDGKYLFYWKSKIDK